MRHRRERRRFPVNGHDRNPLVIRINGVIVQHSGRDSEHVAMT
jgi:hypothetical protein